MTFRYPCYYDLLRSLGRFDAICGYATIAVDFLNEELSQISDPRDWLSRYSKGHGVALHDVDHDSLTPRLGEMFVLFVHARLEEFLRSFLEVHVPASSWPDRGNASLFEHVTKNLSLTCSAHAKNDRETVEYYRLARNVLSHPGMKETRATNQLRKVRLLLNISEDHLAPHPVGRFDYGDFLMYTKAVKAYAAIVCEAARPLDTEIAALIKPHIKLLNRFRNKPRRFRNALRQYLNMTYNLDQMEADKIIDHIMGR